MTAPRRVAVTTAPGATAQRVAGLLRDAGLEPVLLPCIRVVPAEAETLARLRAAAETAEWIVVTSRRAVEHVWPGGGMPPQPSVAAVGAHTAEAVRAAGGRPEIVGAGGAAELRDALVSRLAGSRVVFPHAHAADPAMAVMLAGVAADVVALPAYHTEPVAPGDDPVDAALFGSPSAVAGWTSGRPLTGLVAAALGETTAAALAAAGHPADLMPSRPGYDQLVRDLAAHLHERSFS